MISLDKYKINMSIITHATLHIRGCLLEIIESDFDGQCIYRRGLAPEDVGAGELSGMPLAALSVK